MRPVTLGGMLHSTKELLRAEHPMQRGRWKETEGVGAPIEKIATLVDAMLSI